MKKHILVGTSLLLTLGTAVAGTLMYGQGSSTALESPANEIAPEQLVAGDDRDVEGHRKFVRLPRAESTDLTRKPARDRATGARLRGMLLRSSRRVVVAHRQKGELCGESQGGRG